MPFCQGESPRPNSTWGEAPPQTKGCGKERGGHGHPDHVCDGGVGHMTAREAARRAAARLRPARAPGERDEFQSKKWGTMHSQNAYFIREAGWK